jgi:translation initiation factor IF-3
MRKFYRINQFINSPTVRLIGPDNKQIGVLTRDEALAKAREMDLDLVEVAGGANPPVVRIIEFKKFRYLEQKRDRTAKKGIKKIDTKQIIYTPFIAENDFQTGVKKATKWLKEGNHVKVIVKFVGRQITKKEFGFNLIEKFKKETAEFAKMESYPKFERKTLAATFDPITEHNK